MKKLTLLIAIAVAMLAVAPVASFADSEHEDYEAPVAVSFEHVEEASDTNLETDEDSVIFSIILSAPANVADANEHEDQSS